MMTEETRPRIDVLKAIKEGEVITLSTGVKVRLKSVSAMLMQNIADSIEDPEIPMVEVEVDIGGEKRIRNEPNPSDPVYQAKLAKADNDRGLAALEAMYILGIELVNGVPDPGIWLEDLKYLEKRGRFSLDGYDLKDDRDMEVVYKKFIAVGAADTVLLTEALGVSEERIAQAARSFQSP